jgi:aldose 1-epimerase
MQIDVIQFDQYQGHNVEKIRLTNDHSVSVGVLTMGAILNEFLVPTTNGAKNLILSFDHTAKYFDNLFYVGMSIGRTAGRIKNGDMLLNGKSVHLPSSEGDNNHQGGPHGFYSYMWNYRLHKDSDAVSVTLFRKIQSTEDGYPGNIDVEITFKLSNDNEVSITYSGKSDQDTFFNPTCHAYFNLSETPSILNHQLLINSTQYLEVDDQKIPTGTLLDTTNTAFDFSRPRLLQDSIDQLQFTSEKGLDDIFKLNQPGKIAQLQDLDSKDQIEIYSERNGLVVYTANAMDDSLHLNDGKGAPYRGVALEAQTLPDTHNHDGFGDVSLPANTEKSYTITYKYSRK